MKQPLHQRLGAGFFFASFLPCTIDTRAAGAARRGRAAPTPALPNPRDSANPARDEPGDARMKPVGIRLLPAFLAVGGWTMASRVLGLARDVLMAALLGTGPVAQAFLVAFTLPNMFRRFFAEGAFNTAFVPLFAKRVERGEDPLGFARDAASGLAAILLALCAPRPRRDALAGAGARRRLRRRRALRARRRATAASPSPTSC